ncbi:MAG TPA: molybdenum cofactor guanylyltransferase [Gemmatimonadales bacterium]|nr:molybdenum cofactor guanylyltransferase [Gemmatimonadales bacterium]HRZ08663.1 molybdenum cofactor guanylyltransferase [Gemmatimonadales bacterium]
MRRSAAVGTDALAGRVRGAILAGGGATRFGGRPKGLEEVGGARILDRLVDAFLAALGELPLLVANDPDAAAWHPGLHVLPDVHPGAGALGGILTAVSADARPVVCVAWDMPFVPPALLRRLADELHGSDAVLPASGGPRGVEPMCAGYGPACRAAIESVIAAGDLRAIAFHSAVRTSILPAETVAAFGDPAVLFFNVNTRDDLTQADVLWRRLASSRS